MDPRAHLLQQEWGYTSAREGWYSSVDDPNNWFISGFSREAIYPRGAFQQQNYHDIGTYHYHGVHRSASMSQSYRSTMDSRERGADYGPSIHGSDFGFGNRDDSLKRRDFCNNVRDPQSFSWEKDQCPVKRRERSWSHGHDYCRRSRSPNVRSHNRNYQENVNDDGQGQKDFSAIPSATVKVSGLSKRATAEDLYQILAKWGPLHNVRVVPERDSSSCRGIAFVDFSSIVKARMMMDAIGNRGLLFDGAMLHFEYGVKKTKSKNQQLHERRRGQRRRQRKRLAIAAAQLQPQQDDKKVVAEVVEGEAGVNGMGEDEGEMRGSENERRSLSPP